MSDYDVYIQDLGHVVKAVTKNKERYFGILEVVGDSAMRLEHVINNGHLERLCLKEEKPDDIIEAVKHGWRSRVVNYKNIAEFTRIYPQQEIEKNEKEARKRNGFPDDAEQS